MLGEIPLPEEVTELILLCLPFPVLRETAPFVCKAWAECVQVGGPSELGCEKGLICISHSYFAQSASFWRRYVRRQQQRGGSDKGDKGSVAVSAAAAILSCPELRLASWRILADLFHSNPFDRNLASTQDWLGLSQVARMWQPRTGSSGNQEQEQNPPIQISCCCGDFTSWEITSPVGGGVEEYETGWQSDIVTDELGIVYLSNHFHGDCAKVAFVTDQFSCYKFIKIDLLQKGFTREMLATMRIKLRSG